MTIVKWNGSGSGGRGSAWNAASVVKRKVPKPAARGWWHQVPNISSLPARRTVPRPPAIPSAPSAPSVPTPAKTWGVNLASAFFDALDRRDANKPVCVVCRAKYPVRGGELCPGCTRGVMASRYGTARLRGGNGRESQRG